MNIIKMLLNRLPLFHYDVWYNQSVWMKEEKYPSVYDKDGNYVSCKIGLIVKMGETKKGKSIFYKVVEIKYSKGSDFYYPSDSINCKLKFNHII